MEDAISNINSLIVSDNGCGVGLWMIVSSSFLINKLFSYKTQTDYFWGDFKCSLFGSQKVSINVNTLPEGRSWQPPLTGCLQLLFQSCLAQLLLYLEVPRPSSPSELFSGWAKAWRRTSGLWEEKITSFQGVIDDFWISAYALLLFLYSNHDFLINNRKVVPS